MPDIELQPCPFCASKNDAGAFREKLRYDGHAIVCFGCGAQGPTALGYEYAAKAWNERKGNSESPPAG